MSSTEKKKNVFVSPQANFSGFNLQRTQRICFTFPKAHEADAMSVLPISPQTLFPFPVPGMLSLSTASNCISLEESLHFFWKNNYSAWGKTLVTTEFTQSIVLITSPPPPSQWRPQTPLIPTGMPLCTVALQLPSSTGVYFSTRWIQTWYDLLWPRRYQQKWYKERLKLTLWGFFFLPALENPMNTTRWLRPSLPAGWW